MTYATRPIKRKRRTKAEVEAIEQAMYEIIKAEHPMTVRQVFYRMTTTGLIDKTENEYKTTVGRLLVKLRVNGTIPYGWISDSTRAYRMARRHAGLAEAVHRTAETYRRDLWDNQGVHVEVWVEKDTLAGVLLPVTNQWGVPLFVCRGYTSLTGAYNVAQSLGGHEKPIVIYNVGDLDPSGVDAWRDMRKKVSGHLPDHDITFERIAVTREQADGWNLPSRPTKKTDSRARNFDGESVEVEAIPPARIRSLLEDRIEQWVDARALDITLQAERSERAHLDKMAAMLGGAA